MRYCALVWLSSPGLLLLGSCSVYVPMQGAAPAIRAKGELEVAGGWSLTNRLEVGAAYSPVRHVLVRAATSLKGSAPTHPDSSNYLQNNQYELALGTYWPLGPHWLAGGLAGFGQAHARARYPEDGFSPCLTSSAPVRCDLQQVFGRGLPHLPAQHSS